MRTLFEFEYSILTFEFNFQINKKNSIFFFEGHVYNIGGEEH